MKNLLFLFLSIFLFASCGSTTTTEVETDVVDETTTIASEETEVKNPDKMTVKVKFVEFQLGDLEHYIFEDESGKRWDFAGNDSEDFLLSEELLDSETTDENQGYGSNKELQGKWFDVTYVKREQPQYIDGPMATVEVISEIKLAE